MDELNVNRRSFIKTISTLGALAPLSQSVFAELALAPSSNLTILHTNDWHSRIEAFPKTGSQYPGLGGAASRAALISKIRSENEHVLVLDAGDIFQGTPYFNFYKGELEYKLMSAMGYDVVTLGNHDFDNGVSGLVNQLPNANFGFVNCNYDFGATPLAQVVKPYQIIKKGKLKIGITGVGIDLNGLVPAANYKGITYMHPVSLVNDIATRLKTVENCDLVICLSHLGYQYQQSKIDDLTLAAQSRYIDLIIGGHTHTFLHKPTVVKNTLGKEVLVNQVGWAGLQLGRIDYTFKPLKNMDVSIGSQVLDICSETC